MSFQTRLFVGNVPSKTNENELRAAFATYGDITNLELKSKSTSENEANKFAFITISTTHSSIESCIQSFSNTDFKGSRLYVTRARESFLERLERERAEEQMKNAAKNETPKLAKQHPVMKLNDKLNPRKRKLENKKPVNGLSQSQTSPKNNVEDQKSNLSEGNQKKQDSDKKRLESMRKKRQEFKEKQMIIKTGLVGIDKIQNKKVIFSDNEDATTGNKFGKTKKNNANKKHKTLFDDEDSDNDVNFEIKEQFEGKKGQKVLELQSRYKSDKRFTLDERFIEDDPDAEGGQCDYEKDHKAIENDKHEDDRIELGHTDEKAKQLNILQDVLGFAIKANHDPEQMKDKKKTKSKYGMLRFDPLQPDHAKFLAPVDESKQEDPKKGKKKKQKEEVQKEPIPPPQPEENKIEVSKEQFYKVTDTLKEAISQPNTFSLRSLFKRDDNDEGSNNQDKQEKEDSYIPLHKPKDPKVKNPLDTGSKNPFKYDSSDSESEEEDDVANVDTEAPIEPKAVWREKLFFSENDTRLEDGLAFFNKTSGAPVKKERRELKSVMKKRIYNKERKEQMFKKKIGGRRKSFKKSHRKKK